MKETKKSLLRKMYREISPLFYILKNSNQKIDISKELRLYLNTIDINSHFCLPDHLKEFRLTYCFERFENTFKHKGSTEGLMRNILIDVKLFLKCNKVEAIKIVISDESKEFGEFGVGPVIFEGAISEFENISSSYHQEEREIFIKLLTQKS